MEQTQQMPPPEVRHAEELTRFAEEKRPRPPGWLLTPQAAVAFVCGNDRLKISRKFMGDMSLVERCVIALAGERALLLVGGPGATKSMLSELLSAAICGTSSPTVQGNAGTTEDQLRYDWNHAQLLARGPSEDTLVDSPVLAAMRAGRVTRVEETTRRLPEIQDALVSMPSERRLAVSRLDEYTVHAAPGFCVIATTNLRDRDVSEMGVALKRHLNPEAAEPIVGTGAEIVLMMERTRQVLATAGAGSKVDKMVVEALVAAFRKLHSGVSQEGWAVEKPSTVLSTAEAVVISGPIVLAGAFSPYAHDGVCPIPGQLLGAVRRGDPGDGARLLVY